jgi:hypothetical protein
LLYRPEATVEGLLQDNLTLKNALPGYFLRVFRFQKSKAVNRLPTPTNEVELG